MKNIYNKQILEAIQRGIKLALDDFEDSQNQSIYKSKSIKNYDIKVDFELYNDSVDLRYMNLIIHVVYTSTQT